MTGRDLLEMQLAGSFNMLRERLDMLSDAQWTARAPAQDSPAKGTAASPWFDPDLVHCTEAVDERLKELKRILGEPAHGH